MTGVVYYSSLVFAAVCIDKHTPASATHASAHTRRCFGITTSCIWCLSTSRGILQCPVCMRVHLCVCVLGGVGEARMDNTDVGRYWRTWRQTPMALIGQDTHTTHIHTRS